MVAAVEEWTVELDGLLGGRFEGFWIFILLLVLVAPLSSLLFEYATVCISL